jgi:hypothetical protein
LIAKPRLAAESGFNYSQFLEGASTDAPEPSSFLLSFPGLLPGDGGLHLQHERFGKTGKEKSSPPLCATRAEE